MRVPIIASVLAVGLLAPILPGQSISADATSQRYYRDADGNYVRYKYARNYRDYGDFRRRNNEYSARANNLDPSGEYKAYPDWARIALSPKFDGSGHRR
jgi:hypothetical protein